MFNVALPRLEVRREVVIRRAPDRRGRAGKVALRIPLPQGIAIPPLRLPAPLRIPVPVPLPVPVRAPVPAPTRRPVPRWLLVAGGALAAVALLWVVVGMRRRRTPGALDRPRTTDSDAVAAGVADVPPPRVAPAWFRRFVTARFNPAVARLGLVGGRRSTWGYLEHLGRVSGTLHRTPVRPRIVGGHAYVPLPYGVDVDWARNVRVAGHCRLQVHGTIYDLDEPALVTAADHEGLPGRTRRRMVARGMRYLRLTVLSETPGDLDSAPAGEQPPAAAPVEAPAGA